jgi:hypothetical protein
MSNEMPPVVKQVNYVLVDGSGAITRAGHCLESNLELKPIPAGLSLIQTDQMLHPPSWSQYQAVDGVITKIA